MGKRSRETVQSNQQTANVKKLVRTQEQWGDDLTRGKGEDYFSQLCMMEMGTVRG